MTYAVGVGVASAATVDEVHGLVRETLGGAGIDREAVRTVGTVDIRADHPAVVALGWPVRSYARAELDAVTASVAEAAALLAAGPGAGLVVAKQRSRHATVAVATV